MMEKLADPQAPPAGSGPAAKSRPGTGAMLRELTQPSDKQKVGVCVRMGLNYAMLPAA